MFTKGSYVVYRAEGVCVISDIRAESFNALDKETYFYILSPVKEPKSLLYVPKDNVGLTSMMRPLLSAEEILALAEELCNERIELLPESRSRGAQIKDILSRGDRRELVVLLNTLVEFMDGVKQSGKKLGVTEINAYTKASKLLVEEFSIKSDIDNAEKLMAVISGKEKCLSK